MTCSTAASHASTVNGLGSVTGRALLSVGEFALKGFEVVHIQRRIRHILAAVVESEGKGNLDGKMYSDLLELSRQGMYSMAVKKKAWGSILLLIAAGNIEKLIEHVLKWRDADLKVFLEDLLKFLPRGWLSSAQTEPSPVSKRARHLQDPDSSLPMQLVYFMYGLLETSARLKALPGNLEDAQASVLSFTSFVSSSGKMTLGPSVFLQGLDLYAGHTAIASVVKFYVCARLNRISTLLRTFTGFSSPPSGHLDCHSEILEIYRLFAHDRSVQRQTKELLFISIARFHAASLVHTLAEWSPEFLRLFIILVMRWTLAFVKPTLSMDDTSLPKAYRIHLAMHVKGQHPVLPFLAFFSQLAMANPQASEMLLELNIIPALKMMCIHNYPNPASYASTSSDSTGSIALSDVCASSIMLVGALSSHPATCRRLLRQRDFPRWFLSFYYHSEFIGIPDAPLLQGVWISLENPMARFALCCVEHVLKDDTLHITPQEADYLPLEHIYRDIIEVLRDSSSEPEMLQSASDSLFRCIALRGEFVDVLDATFASGRVVETIAVLRTAVRSLGLCPTPPSHRSISEPSKRHSGEVPPFPPEGTPLSEVKSYVKRLAYIYTDDLKIYTSLVADLVGSQACNARYTLLDRWVKTSRPLLGEHASELESSQSLVSFHTATSSFS
ncbi:hypothetical protein EIP91_007634 [Steccherinum ochraceum]|uniref:Uncharacterized protein n=1 Tax=Steccherinum ochraceum TaxID=92696 RepID=A0A4R0RI58_9APHY|nr:hypothetical protein EIP91_007634 [Steccherinum ochraceum]